ncbi:MAG TPA: class I SAM-dependent methyltransferase [Candidatus Galloscillospira stercoripullorum]|nr:class I SAM-dependent methyltransferase [Candidatus Galloscillospira stercoripullorum]
MNGRVEIRLYREWPGRILDIGGGGEGVIGRLYQEQVTAIDNRPEELAEAPEGFEKVVMDAADLDFDDGSFHHVTVFFTLMYMEAEEQRRAIAEAARVLKAGGELHIWDCDIPSAWPEPFCVDVEVALPGEHISTTYGVGKQGTQDRRAIRAMCLDAGLTLVAERGEGEAFYLCFRKEG